MFKFVESVCPYYKLYLQSLFSVVLRRCGFINLLSRRIKHKFWLVLWCLTIMNTAAEPWINSKHLKPHNLFTSLLTKHNIKLSTFVINSTLKSILKNIRSAILVSYRKSQLLNHPSVKTPLGHLVYKRNLTFIR